jgi:hypothetical protein
MHGLCSILLDFRAFLTNGKFLCRSTEGMAEFIYWYICVHKVDKVFLSHCGTLFLTSKTSKVSKFNCQIVDQYFELDFPPL